MTSLLIIGGTGIIGKPLTEIARAEHDVYCLAKDEGLGVPEGVEFIKIDKRNKVGFVRTIADLVDRVGEFDVVFDICQYDEKDSQITYEALRKKAKHIFILSTTLVYDRSGFSFQPIKSNHPLAEEGKFGGYVDGKLKVEGFWQGITDVNWTILRPYHILGAGSFLGCLPPHNRDPQLPEIISSSTQITLCDGGRIPLNIVHPRDIGQVVLHAANNPKTFGKAYNVVNPKEVIARDYFSAIANETGATLQITDRTATEFWARPIGWCLTTLPHLYDVSDLMKDIGYIPETSLEECISDALGFRPVFDKTKITERWLVGKGILDVPVHRNMNKPPCPERHGYY